MLPCLTYAALTPLNAQHLSLLPCRPQTPTSCPGWRDESPVPHSLFTLKSRCVTRVPRCLQDVGVQLEKGGAIKVDEYSQTSVPNIYAIGDVTNRMALTPVAIMEGMAFVKTAFGGAPTKPNHDKVSLCFDVC